VELRVEHQGAGALVTIRDQGIVFAEQSDLDTLPSARGDNAAALDIPGTGLGLYACGEIARGYGGELSVLSPNEAGGTSVSCWLPGPAFHATELR
jgi:signal transduction histidine kinase